MATHHRWALAAAAVAGVSVLSVQQTGALWSDSAESSGATISSGRLDIAVGNSGSEVAKFQFSALAASNMVSGAYVQRPLHVRNAGNMPLWYRLDSVTPSNASLPLRLQVTAVSSEAECPASGDAAGKPLYADDLIGASTVDRKLEAGASEILCFRVTMGENPPAGKEGAATFTFLATQL